ncbi:MAG: esterase family protein [Thermoleophilales bacterium]|nr:esterase family protein [Thermoleophilales bacterium]
MAPFLFGAFDADAKVKLLDEERLDSRLVELELSTPNVEGATRVRVLLPEDYRDSSRQYPVLYLLHGAADDYRSWTDKGDAEAATRGRPLIVVMPDSGPIDAYTNWNNDGAGGPPAWENYHIGELIPFIDRHFRTRADRTGRAIAGLSMGGYGTMIYAARHPDLFTAAAAFSGAVNLTHPLILAIAGSRARGVYETNKLRYERDNPLTLAGNLRGLDLTLRTGDGTSGGPLDPDGGFDIVEKVVYEASLSMHQRLGRLGIAHRWDYYGAGDHTWPYWQRDLKQTLPDLMRRFRNRTPAPARINYKSADPAYTAYGWSVRLKRKADEFTALAGAGRKGFRLSGSGKATVRTAPLFRACRRFKVRIEDERGIKVVRRATGRGHRLRIGLDLGPANRYEQYTEQDQLAGDRSVSARVTFRPDGWQRCGAGKRSGN